MLFFPQINLECRNLGLTSALADRMSNNLQFLHVLLLKVQWSHNASKFSLHPSAAKLILCSRPQSQGWVMRHNLPQCMRKMWRNCKCGSWLAKVHYYWVSLMQITWINHKLTLILKNVLCLISLLYTEITHVQRYTSVTSILLSFLINPFLISCYLYF